MRTGTIAADIQTTDFLPLKGTDYIELYVGNAKQAAHFYKTAFGFQSLAYAGPETGVKDRASYVLVQNKIRLVLTTPLYPDHPISEQLIRHDDYGQLKMSGIYTYGETVHMFVERKNYNGLFMPGYEKWDSSYNPEPTGLLYVDHCVGNVGWNQMDKWVKFYEDVMGFKNILTFDDKQISTEYSALMSKVMSNGNGYVKFPINEPAEGKKRSQVEEYLDFYGDEGVQHIAIATNDIVDTVSKLEARGVEFLKVPGIYYDDLESRVGKIEEDIKPLKKLGILVDRDEEGYLLQIFTKPVEDRPTLFFEIIQRKGAKSFGAGNFKALFEALEREQEARGNL